MRSHSLQISTLGRNIIRSRNRSLTGPDTRATYLLRDLELRCRDNWGLGAAYSRLPTYLISSNVLYSASLDLAALTVSMLYVKYSYFTLCSAYPDFWLLL